jgi:hypothetical protein
MVPDGDRAEAAGEWAAIVKDKKTAEWWRQWWSTFVNFFCWRATMKGSSAQGKSRGQWQVAADVFVAGFAFVLQRLTVGGDKGQRIDPL